MSTWLLPLLLTVGCAPESTVGGAWSVELWLADPDGPRRVESGDAMRAGDVVQVRVHDAPGAWAGLSGVDGHGAVQVWGGWATRQGWDAAPFALELDDDASGLQHIYVVFADEPLAEDELAAVAEGRPLDRGLAWWRFEVAVP